MQKTMRVRLHVLSPVHIGCDDVYEPTGFVIDRQRKKLIAFDPIDFVGTLSEQDRRKFLGICEKGTMESIIEIYRFMNEHKGGIDGHAVGITDGFIDSYNRVARMSTSNSRNIQQELNKFLVSRTSYAPFDNAAYIPGSALKGALRTGWLNRLNNRYQRQGARGSMLETELLGGTFAEDPFRMVKVSDFLPVGNPETHICFAINKKKKPSKYEAQGPNQILEVIQPGAVFEGVITIHSPESNAKLQQKRAVPVSEEFLQQALAFFAGELTHEESLLQGIGLTSGVRTKLNTLLPVRLGRHSGAEALTIEGARNIKIMGKRGEQAKYLPNSSTIWFAADTPKAESGLQLFGWIALEVVAMDSGSLYPQRTFGDRVTVGAIPAAIAVPAPTMAAEKIIWESAILTWDIGKKTLKAVNGTDRTELRIGDDQSVVPEALRKKLFVKKDAVKAMVTLEKQGSMLKIVTIELPALEKRT